MAYTYLIGWTRHNRWYYGVRFAKECHLNELFVTYFTSSKYVKQFTKDNGPPDVIQIRKIFETKEKAILWENKVLTRMRVIYDDKFLNKTNNKAIRVKNIRRGFTPWNKGICGSKRSVESIEKQRRTMTGKSRGKYNYIQSEEQRKNSSMRLIGNKINSGRKQSNHEKLVRSSSGKNIFWWTNGIIEVKSKICPPEFYRGRLRKHNP